MAAQAIAAAETAEEAIVEEEAMAVVAAISAARRWARSGSRAFLSGISSFLSVY
jgi:hypothetical protein